MPSSNHTTLTFQSTSPNQMFGILKSKKTSKLSQYETVFCLNSGMSTTLQFTPKKQVKTRKSKKTCHLESSSDCTKSESSQESIMLISQQSMNQVSTPLSKDVNIPCHAPNCFVVVKNCNNNNSIMNNSTATINDNMLVVERKKVVRTSISIRELLN